MNRREGGRGKKGTEVGRVKCILLTTKRNMWPNAFSCTVKLLSTIQVKQDDDKLLLRVEREKGDGGECKRCSQNSLLCLVVVCHLNWSLILCFTRWFFLFYNPVLINGSHFFHFFLCLSVSVRKVQHPLATM